MGALLAAAGLSGGLGLLNSGINNIFGGLIGEYTRKRNYYYNELAATNAMNRQISLYNQIQSPAALMKQYKEAGLSPSLMFGGTPGQGSTGGAPMGAGPSGPMQPFAPASMVEAAQAANLMADTAVKKEEAKNISKDTDLKELEREFKDLNLQQYKDEWQVLNSSWENSDTGEQTSLFEMARDHFTFDSFLEAVRKDEATGNTNFHASTEAEIKILRNVFENANRFHRDIMVLSEESVNAKFQMELLEELNKEGFQKLNAEAAVAQLKTVKAASELTETQKEAWNNLIDKLGKKGSTMRDIVVVIGMILSNFASHTGIKITVP